MAENNLSTSMVALLCVLSAFTGIALYTLFCQMELLPAMCIAQKMVYNDSFAGELPSKAKK